MLKKILLGFLALVAVLLVVVALRPGAYRVERSVVIAAPAAQIFSHVNNLRRTEAWNPWLKLDPAIKIGYAGSAEGVGAVSTWAGNSEVGEGTQTIVESRTNQLVRVKLDFKKPFEDTSTGEFTFSPDKNGTRVTWAMYGENKFLAKAICLFMNQDKMVGDAFEKGLATLKTLNESVAKK